MLYRRAMEACRSVFVLATLLAVGCGGRAAYEGGASGAAGTGSSGGSGAVTGSLVGGGGAGMASGGSAGLAAGGSSVGTGQQCAVPSPPSGLGGPCRQGTELCDLGVGCVDGLACSSPAGGVCVSCPSGMSACGLSLRVCVDEQTDPNNCGACGVVCAQASMSDTSLTCENGNCVPIADASADASGDVLVGAASGSQADAGRVPPVNHRPSDAQCSTSAPPGDCLAPFPDAGCASDNDCIEAGTNGRCINRGGGPAAPCVCTSDTCSVDTDCPNGQTCACHGAPYADGHSNTCVTGNCRVDADCGAGGYCSPSSLTAICGDSLAGYYCHTARDLCVDDNDCTAMPGPGIPGCVYSTTDSRWECDELPVCL
jgi:hypothetical protein